jgi:hypothetical protein
MLAQTETSYLWVFWIVAIARFLVPLAIPRFPLPGILAALILDAVDQTIFQQFPGMELEGYQGYDKALDIYCLAVAYITTLRNWSNLFALRVSRFLFYWRLVGVALFELTHLRWLLLVFPNTFEYFFIFYEAYRLRWNPERMSNKLLISAAAAIWIVIKLPQEYWIHIGQIDTTDWIKTSLFKVPADTSWAVISRTWPWVFVVLFALVAALLSAVCWLARRRLRPADYALSFSADAHQPAFSVEQVRGALANEASRIGDVALVEKIVLITLVSMCFGQVLPGVQATNLQFAVGVPVIVLVNTALSHWLARRGFGWAFSFGQFIALAAVNLVGLLAYAFLRTRFDDAVSVVNILFFVLLLTLLITLFDRYRQVYLMRFSPGD